MMIIVIKTSTAVFISIFHFFSEKITPEKALSPRSNDVSAAEEMTATGIGTYS